MELHKAPAGLQIISYTRVLFVQLLAANTLDQNKGTLGQQREGGG